MRRHVLFSLLALLLVGGYAAAGTAVAAGVDRDRYHDHAREITVNGTVTGPAGEPASGALVLLGEDRTLTRFSPHELRALAADDPDNLTVVAVGNDGRFEATVGSRRAEAAVAVSDAGVSDLAHLGGENASLSLGLHERRPQTVHAHLGAVSHDERRAQLYVSLVNSGDAPIETLSVRVGSVPDGWSVAGAETTGSYRPDDRTLTWGPVPPGGEVDATVALAVPEGAPPGEYTVALRAGSDTHRVDVADETVEVLPEETPGPTTTPPPGDDGEITGSATTGQGDVTASRTPPSTPATPTADATAGTGTGSTGASWPGLGTVTATAALALLALLLVRRI